MDRPIEETSVKNGPHDLPQTPVRALQRREHAVLPVLPEVPASVQAQTNVSGEVCRFCKGAGFLRSNVPFGHPQFGKAIACQCKELERKRKRRQQLQEISNLGAFAEKRFETFNPRMPGLWEVFQAAREFAGEPGLYSSWFLLVGPNGCGKTHLAAAIANECLEAGMVVLFATVPDLLDHLRAAFSPNTTDGYDQLFLQMRAAEVLVLDDLGADVLNRDQRRILFDVIEERSLEGSVVVTSQVPIEKWGNVIGEAGAAEAICDRLLENCHRIALKGASRRGGFRTNPTT